MKFDVFQINFTDEQVDLINESETRPDFYLEYLDTNFRPTAEAIVKAKLLALPGCIPFRLVM